MKERGIPQRTLSVIIPVYNEARSIEAVVRRVQHVKLVEVEKEIIVVDDGSTDGTTARLQQLDPSVHVIVHPRNRGKGAAIRSGFQAATGDLLLIQDADLEYDPHDYSALIAPILRGDTEVVMGSRFAIQKPRFFTRGGDPFFSHYIGNQLIIWLTNLLYGFHATDYEACYKVITRRVMEEIPVHADGFEFDNELVCKLLRRRRTIVEVPVHYQPRVYADGKKIRWHHGMRMFWTILKWRLMPV